MPFEESLPSFFHLIVHCLHLLQMTHVINEGAMWRDAKFLFEGQGCGRGGVVGWAGAEFEQLDKKRFWPLLEKIRVGEVMLVVLTQ